MGDTSADLYTHKAQAKDIKALPRPLSRQYKEPGETL